MKRLLPLLLGLAVSVAQADSNSDYRAVLILPVRFRGRVQAVFRALSHRRVSPAITLIRTRQNITVV
ncbi:hypothetical protein ECZC18_53490 [Escherichia coli]|nr:hypothetical protein ECZC18_53490 [Escherichia coli]